MLKAIIVISLLKERGLSIWPYMLDDGGAVIDIACEGEIRNCVRYNLVNNISVNA